MKHFLYILGFLFSVSVHARVQIFLGFMDDEVNGVLERTLQSQSNMRVLAISSNVLSDEVKGQTTGLLFGRPISSYTGEAGILTTTHYGGQVSHLLNRKSGPGLQLYTNLANLTQAMDFRSKLDRGSSNDAPRRTAIQGILDPSLSVIEFVQPTFTSDLIIIIRSPEMGRQPNLVRAYLEPILDAIKSLPEASQKNGGMQLSVFGTSGGINPKYKPGFIAPVEGSLYVGVEIDPNINNSKRNRGVVSWIGKDKQKPTYYFNKAFATRAEAESAARAAFVSPNFDISRPLNSKGLKFREAVESETRNGIAASLTTSFFAGPDEKERGNALGLVTVDMEDSQVLELAREKAIPFTLKRLVTDPAHIPDSARDAIARWSRSGDYGSEDYVQAILWGLRGGHLSDLEKRPALRESAKWKLFDEPEMLEHRHLVSSLQVQGEKLILDPIFAEITAEFLKDAANGSLLSTSNKGTHNYDGIIYKSILEQLGAQGIKELNQLMDEKSQRIATIARRISNESSRNQTEASVRPLIEELISKCLSLEIPKDTPLHDKLSKLLAAEIERAPNPVDKNKAQRKFELFQKLARIRLLGTHDADLGNNASQYRYSKWVVQTRWAGNTGRKLRYLGFEGLDPVAQDRLFYRSGLVTLTSPALRNFVDAELAGFIPNSKAGCAPLIGAIVESPTP